MTNIVSEWPLSVPTRRGLEPGARCQQRTVQSVEPAVANKLCGMGCGPSLLMPAETEVAAQAITHKCQLAIPLKNV